MSRKPKPMRTLWPWPAPSRGEFLAIVAGVILVAIFVVIVTRFPGFSPLSNSGFGPGWECIWAPHSEQVCVKRTAPPPR